jgi:hypothetical protein
MNDPSHVQSPQSLELVADLRQLIAALDRRVPQLTRSGEAAIAREAAALRARAVDLIRQVQGDGSTAQADGRSAAPLSVQK